MLASSDTLQITPQDSLSQALREAAPGSSILLRPGIYREKIEISVPGIRLIGHGAQDTKIVYGDYAEKPDAHGTAYNTFRTYTAAVLAPHVSFLNLTVENDALEPETKGQEVALSVLGDSFRMENCLPRDHEREIHLLRRISALRTPNPRRPAHILVVDKT